MLFLFFFFFPWISRYQNAMIKCQNVSFTKPRRFLILHVTRALISFEPFFFFFLKKEKKRFNFVDSFDEARNENCENITTRRIKFVIIEGELVKFPSLFIYR